MTMFGGASDRGGAAASAARMPQDRNKNAQQMVVCRFMKEIVIGLAASVKCRCTCEWEDLAHASGYDGGRFADNEPTALSRAMRNRSIGLRLLLVLMVATVAVSEVRAADTVRCQHGAVVCVSGPAADAGLATLNSGGNSVDAAVATAFALAVTYPPAGNIGGGGYMLVVPEDAAGSAVFDFREVAPAAATREMFVHKSGRTAHRRVGVPGTVRGLALAHKRFGKLSWK